MTPEAFLDLKRAALRRCFSRMNPQQFEAVTTINGPLLVLAGAGSGKTTVIVHRMACMVLFGDTLRCETPLPDEEGLQRLTDYSHGDLELTLGELQQLLGAPPVPPWQILAITFTNKAAGEMKSRLEETLGETAQEIHAATFHSACVRMLRACADRMGYDRGFTIYDTDDSLRTIKACLKELSLDEKLFTPKSVLGAISHAKSRMISPETMETKAQNDYRQLEIAKIYRAYQARLMAGNAMDFDDLLYVTVRVFETCPEVLAKYRGRYRYILVDEYQDTNYAQYRLISLLAANHQNLCVVGDDDQSIYRFRGASIENILQFEEQFPGCRVIRLEENYRSTQNILDAANAVIANNKSRREKRLWTAAGAGDSVHLLKAPTEREESEFILDRVEEGVAEGKSYRDFAVLYRMNALSNALERAMVRRKIPYRIYSGVRFLDRKEIRDVVAYLCVLQNPYDLVRFARILNVPKRGIGESTTASILQIAQDLDMSPLEVAQNARDFPALSRRAGALLDFAEMMGRLEEKRETLSLEALFDCVLEETGYLEMLRGEGSEGENRLENVQEFRSNIVSYREENPEPTLEGFLEETALYTEADSIGDDNAVSMMTMHAAKGLEFDTVFAVGMENGIFPGKGNFDTLEDMEEERRLAYVTITRAKRELYLTYAENRLLFGSAMTRPLSLFVGEIPKERLQVEDLTARRMAVPASLADRPAVLGGASLSAQRERIRRQRTAPAGDVMTFRAGERISDAGFGDGTVLKAQPLGGDCLLEVAFDKAGTKKLMARYRKIRKI